MLCLGTPEQRSFVISVDLGRYEPDPLDTPLGQVVGTVLHLHAVDAVTIRGANKLHAELITELRREFLTVEPIGESCTGGGLAVAERNVDLFPSPEARKILADMRRELVAAAE
jgi:hypothetical protein